MNTPADVVKIYEKAEEEVGKWPYALGGGHNKTLSPSPATIGAAGAPGYDCSSFLMMLINAGAPTEMPASLGPLWGTHELETWALEGYGEYLAVRVFDGVHDGHVVEHSVLELRKGFPASHRYVMAFFTGGPKANFVPEADFDASFYRTRRKATG